jgi:hypothetical protein
VLVQANLHVTTLGKHERQIGAPTNISETLGALIVPMLRVTLILSAASVAPQQDKPMVLAIPAAWSNAQPAASRQASSLAQWWTRFDDPLLSQLVAGDADQHRA